MFRRLFWMIVGAGFSLWVMRRMRNAVDRVRPERIAADLGDALRSFGADLRAAAADGRAAMHEREAELRHEIHADIDHT